MWVSRPCQDYWPINTLRCQDNDDDCSNSFQEQLNLCQSNLIVSIHVFFFFAIYPIKKNIEFSCLRLF